MKKVIKWATVILFVQLLLVACTKIDWDDLFRDGNKSQRCDLASFTLTQYPDLPHPFLFIKQYDPSGKYVNEINAAFNNVRLPDQLHHYRLRLEYKTSKIYFIRMESPYDTVVTAWLNHQGRVIKTISRNEAFENIFVYRHNRLFSIQWRTGDFGVKDTCEYDAYGNILSIAHTDENGRIGYFYEYDYSKKVKQQAYLEEVRNFNNDFTLMQYMGFFPELDPVNLRTRARNGQEHGYSFEYYLGNHVLDAKGRLTRYDLVTPPGYPQEIISQAFLAWHCK